MGTERGSAVAEFVMVSALLSLLFVGLLQLGFVLHTRNTLIASAAEGARVQARAGAGPADGVARTRELITAQLSPRFGEDISAGSQWVRGARVVVVTVSAPMPVVGPLGPGRTLTVSARAYAEEQ